MLPNVAEFCQILQILPKLQTIAKITKIAKSAKNVINMIVEMPCVIQINNIWHGFDDTLGSIIQAHISNKMINETSLLNLVGYKRTHPLEDKYLFTMSFNPGNHLSNPDTEEKTKTASIIDVFSQCCDELISIFNTIMVAGNGV